MAHVARGVPRHTKRGGSVQSSAAAEDESRSVNARSVVPRSDTGRRCSSISNDRDRRGRAWELRVTVVSWCALTTGLSPLNVTEPRIIANTTANLERGKPTERGKQTVSQNRKRNADRTGTPKREAGALSTYRHGLVNALKPCRVFASSTCMIPTRAHLGLRLG